MLVKFRSRDYKDLKKFTGYQIWEQPKSTHVYAIGADVAEGVGGDASCAQVVNCNTGVHVAKFWSNLIDVDNYAAELCKLGWFYNKAPICVESNNHGLAVISLLGAHVGGLAYPNLYRRFVYHEYLQERTKEVGFKTTPQTKPRLIENLKSALRDGSLSTYDPQTILELNSFQQDLKTGKLGAQGAAHDDCVMSLALAWEQARLLNDQKQQSQSQSRPQMKFDQMTGFPIGF
jgi:hypothetical protein